MDDRGWIAVVTPHAGRSAVSAALVHRATESLLRCARPQRAGACLHKNG